MFCFPFAFSYVSGNNTFLKQLTKEEEMYYIKAYENGDKEAETILIERNLRLVAHVVKKYSGNSYDNEDLISIGTIGLIKGIKSFKSDKNIKLATYCARCIENEILMSFRVNKKHKIVGSLSDPIGSDKDGNEIHKIDRIEDDKMDIQKQVETNIQIETMMNFIEQVLTKQEYEIIKLRYGIGCEPLPQREIGKMLGISRSYVSRIEKKALGKLKQVLS